MEGSGYKLTFDRDYHDVCRSLRNLHRRGDLIALGIALGLSYQTVLGMGNGDDFLSQIMAAWLKQQDNVLSQSGEPTWSVLADKLEEIGCSEVAADIGRKDEDPQHKGQQDGNPSAALSADISDSLTDNQQCRDSSLSEQSCVPHCSDQTTAPINTQSVIKSTEQDQPYTSACGMCHEQPPAPKRTKLDQKSVREQSGNQQLSCTTSKQLKPLVTHAYTMGQMFSPIVTLPYQAQPTESNSLQIAVSTQALNSSLPPPPTCTVSTSSHPATSLLVTQGTQNRPKALPSTGDPIKAEEAGEAFRECRADLLEAIVDPLILANHLYSKKIISRETLNQITELSLTISNKNIILLNVIEARIRTHPSDFRILLAILEHNPHLCVYAEGLRNSYCLLCTQSSLGKQPSNMSATMQMNMYLMNYYKCSQVPLDTKYPYIQEKVFIALAIIEKELISRVNADKFTKGTLHGHADEILQKKKPIEFKSVLEPPEGQQSMKCVFVEGAPGIGKSTFALEFCRQQEGVEAFSLVVLLRLREKRVQEIQNVTQLFYHENTDLQQAVTKEVITCEGKNVLFVLDGFDELPTALRNNSFIVELIQGKHLPKCMVLVTSRPSATADLNFSCKRQIHKHIEILGFTHERIWQYAESMLSDEPDILQDFLKYISNNPAIYGMMYIPLNSAIVLEIYKANRTTGKPVPCTVTQLYTELCLVLLRKYLLENNNPLVANDQLWDRLKDIPPALRDKVLKLGKLALEGALRQQITFKQLPDGCVDLGFMNVSTELYLGRKPVVSYSFLHLTLQEFLAAFYISELPGVEQKLLFIENMLISKNNIWFKDYSHGHLDVLWRFMAGLTGFKDVGWELVGKAMQGTWNSSMQVLFVHCLLELQNEQMIKSACDTIVKANEATRIRPVSYSLFGDDKPYVPIFHVKNLCTPFDCYALGYCVAASGYKWDFNLEHVGGNEVTEMLGYGLLSNGNVSQCGHFNNLNLAKNSLTYQGIASFREFPSNILNQIHTLNLASNQLNKDSLDCLAVVLSHMINLTYLNVSCNPVSPSGMVELFQNLSNTKVTDFEVHETNLDISDIQALRQLLRLNKNLRKLSIGNKDMSPECVSLMIETLLSSSSLIILQLWWISYTPKGACSWKVLENNTNLIYLKLINNLDGLNLAIPCIAKALHKNESLTTLEISVGKIDNENHFRIDYRFGCDIGIDSVKALSEMFKVNKKLCTLEILANKLTQDEVMMLSYALQENTTLHYLGLHPDAIATTVTIDKRIASMESVSLL